MPTWRPPVAASRPATTQRVLSPADYLEAWCRPGESVYQRREMGVEGPEAVDTYVRRNTTHRISEGSLADRWLMPLDAYLQKQDESAGDSSPTRRPTAPLGKAFWVFFEVAEPMDPIPPAIADGEPAVTTTSLQYFDRTGRPVARGTLTRTAVLEGYEQVTCPAGRFDRCMRVRVDLRVYFPLVLTINWNSYVWISPEAGEVRRVQQFSGWFLLFWFGSAHEFLLESHDGRSASAPAAPPTHWARGMVNLGRKLPRPRIEGIVVDVVATQPAP
ncbi:MAG TPA: hypothetical protein VLM89_01620 [Phycisphaerae bacterium]|nr:hypothetical protein [Phycisphaerae bacterium]